MLRLETLLQRYGVIKPYNSTCFQSAVSAGKEKPKHAGNFHKIEKVPLVSGDHIFLKNCGNILTKLNLTNFQVYSLSLELSILGLRFFDEALVSVLTF